MELSFVQLYFASPVQFDAAFGLVVCWITLAIWLHVKLFKSYSLLLTAANTVMRRPLRVSAEPFSYIV